LLVPSSDAIADKMQHLMGAFQDNTDQLAPSVGATTVVPNDIYDSTEEASGVYLAIALG
jgi:hypothetical protein